MRIGIEAQRLLRPHKHGMDIVALELINALQLIDHENEYFIFVRPDEDNDFLRLQAYFKLVLVEGANYIHSEQIALPRALRRYKLDLLHCTANTAPLLSGVPLILTLHDVLFLKRTPGKNTATLYQRLGNLYRALLAPRLVNRCRKIVTVSEFASEQIRAELDTSGAPIDVLYNGVNERFTFPPTPDQLIQIRAAYQLPERYFLFLGSADPRKNFRNVLHAFIQYGQTNNDSKLVISGKQPAFLKQLLNAEEYTFVEERCQFIGYIDDADLQGIYTMADIFLFPSISEGFGLPILEAMACGTPVITGNCTAMPEVAGNAALLVDPHQPDRITEAMQLIQDDQNFRRVMIQLGKERVEHFSWTRTAQQLLEMYRTFTVAPAYSPA